MKDIAKDFLSFVWLDALIVTSVTVGAVILSVSVIQLGGAFLVAAAVRAVVKAIKG